MLNNGKKNLAYLFFQNTLFNGEVQLLKNRYNVYYPKRFTNMKAGPEILDDKELLTDPILDEFDFFHGGVNEEIFQRMDRLFDIIMLPVINYDLVSKLLNSFKGKVYIRYFGKLDNGNYESHLIHTKTIDPFLQSKNSFLLSAYKRILNYESKRIQDKSLFLPLPLHRKILPLKNSWNGEKKKIMFVCSFIMKISYYKEKFDEFVNNFGSFDYNIFGRQTIPLENNKLISNLSDEDFYNSMRDYAVLVCTSRETIHVHYHPIEAIYVGLPVIYFKNFLLDALIGGSQYASCQNFNEMREKVTRILNGDKEFIKNVIEENQRCLTHFTDEYYMQILDSMNL